MVLEVSPVVRPAKTYAPKPKLLLCFSHLRWNFVFQRPQHLLTRAARSHDVIFFEEPLYEDVATPMLRMTRPQANLRVVTPVLPQHTTAAGAINMQRILLNRLLAEIESDDDPVLWYYTPMALRFSDHLDSSVCVYDCMDELSAFRNAPPELTQLERLLMERADLVFTGGQSIYEAKRRMHSAIYPFPSSIDTHHFQKARMEGPDPADQAEISRPRVGYFGVIDERLDVALVAHVAAQMPDVQFIMIGPVVKIDPADLPRLPNIHWLGGKSYAELPGYMRHWDAGWMPFALNEATRYISPTKTPEFLAAGLPVVSTAIVDVVRTYGAMGLVDIADRDDMAEKLRQALGAPRDQRRTAADLYLASMSWDLTWSNMAKHIARASALRQTVPLRVGA